MATLGTCGGVRAGPDRRGALLPGPAACAKPCGVWPPPDCCSPEKGRSSRRTRRYLYMNVGISPFSWKPVMSSPASHFGAAFATSTTS